MTDPSLKSFVDRLENLDTEQKGIGTDKRDVFDEAAKAGYDKKAIRRLLRDRREAAKDQGTAELAEQYKMLLSEPGATYRSVAAKMDIPRSTLHRRVPRDKNGTEESCGPCPVPPGDPMPVSTQTACERRGEAEHHSPATRRHTSDDALAPAIGTPTCEDGASPGPQDTIDLTIPARLDRRINARSAG